MPLQIAPHIYQLRAFGCQVFALLGDEVTLIDAGWPGSGPLVLRQLRELGRGPSDVTRIVLTHYHIDHRGAAEELRRATGARVYIHASEAPYLRGLVPYPNPVRWRPLAALAAPLMAAMRGRPLPVSELNDHDRFDVLGGLQVLHVPGHTQGSVALWLADQGLLFSGDTMMYRWRRLAGPGRNVSEDMGLARLSLERLAGLDVDTICFSHFPVLEHGAKRALEQLVATWSTEFRNSPHPSLSPKGRGL
jgi:glyoxylase-like metal-dependent hydrolase (beta-lactamase superfamily II)